VKECVGVWVKARSAFQLFSFSLQHPLRAAGQWIKQMVSARSAFQFSAFQFSAFLFSVPPRRRPMDKANGVRAKHLSVFSISVFSFSLQRPAAPQANG
jgi:hypothetical protein